MKRGVHHAWEAGKGGGEHSRRARSFMAVPVVGQSRGQDTTHRQGRIPGHLVPISITCTREAQMGHASLQISPGKSEVLKVPGSPCQYSNYQREGHLREPPANSAGWRRQHGI